MMIFVALLLVGYVYILKKGMFEWNERARQEAEAEAHVLAESERRRRRAPKAAPAPVRAA
jgi:hypothetical protein